MLKSVYDCSVIELPRIENAKGNITPVHSGINLPFEIARIFYLYDIPGGEARGAHAHRECHQFLVAASGSFEVVLDDGYNKRTVTLNRPTSVCTSRRVSGLPSKAFLRVRSAWY